MLAAANLTPLLLGLLHYAAGCVGFNLTCWAVADKYNLWERYDTYKPTWMPERCAICIPFWFCLLYTLPVAALSGRWELLLAPFISAGVTLKTAAK